MKNKKLQEFLQKQAKKFNRVLKFGPAVPAVLAAVLAVVVVGSYDGSIPEVIMAKTPVEPGEAAQQAQEEEQAAEKRVVSALSPVEEEETESIAIETVAETGVYSDGTYYGTGRGFQGGALTAEVVVADGAMTDIQVVSAQYDGGSYLAACQPLIEEMLASQTTNVDAVSGATYSSRGIIGAVRNALDQASGASAAAVELAADTAKTEEQLDLEPYSDSEAGNVYRDGTYIGMGKGFQDGTFQVKVTVKNGKISAISIKEAQYDGEEFLEMVQPLIQKIVKKQSTDVDAVSGATYSSRGLIQAVRSALEQAKVEGTAVRKDTEEKISENTETGATVLAEEVEEETETDTSNGLKDGTYYGTGKSFRDGEMKIKVLIAEGKITSITIESAEYDGEKWLASLSAMIDKMLESQSADVDAVSGATYSSRGLTQALKDVLAQAVIVPSDIPGGSDMNVFLIADADGGENAGTADDGGNSGESSTGSGSGSSSGSGSGSSTSGGSSTGSSGGNGSGNGSSIGGNTGSGSSTSGGSSTGSSSGNSTGENADAVIWKGTAYVYPDEGEDFTEYEISVDVSVVGDMVTGITAEILSDSKEAYTNQFFMDDALDGSGKLVGIEEQIKALSIALNNGSSTNVGVDAVSGATCSSWGIIDAVNEALKSSGTYPYSYFYIK